MSNTILIVIALVIFGGVSVYAGSKIEKTPKGLIIKDTTVHTYYMNRIIWGDTYSDHVNATAVHNTVVIAYGTDWEYATTTDDDGVFTVEVKANTPFMLKASDGNNWSVSEEQAGVPVGTTKDDRS